MVAKPMILKDLISSEPFGAVSDEVCKRTNSTLFPTYNEVLFEATRNRYEKSGIPIEELYDLLVQKREQFVKYSCALVLDSRGAEIEQEYHPSEEPGEEERWAVVKEFGLARDFIVRHLIVYWFLVKNPSELEGYLKSTRTPNAKKQAKKLKQLLEALP